jgi:hypothetical protein
MIQSNKDVERVPTSERGQNSRAVIPKSIVNGLLPNQVFYFTQTYFIFYFLKSRKEKYNPQI